MQLSALSGHHAICSNAVSSAPRQANRVLSPTVAAAKPLKQSPTFSRRRMAFIAMVAPLLLARRAHAKDAAELAKEKEARKQALKDKAKQTQESGESFEGEEFGKNYEPPKSETMVPGFLKNI